MIMFEGISRIIFDLDNVIIKHDHEKEAINICNQLGIKYSEDFKNEFAFMFQQLNRFVRNKMVTRHLIVSGANKYMPILMKHNKTGLDLISAISYKDCDISMDNAKELLEYLQKRGYEIVALTNWFYSDQAGVLKRLGLLNYFNRIYSWDNYYAKPNELSFIRALDGKDPLNCVMIGDDLKGDVIPAKKLGIHTIGFNIDYSKKNNQKASERPDADVKNLLEIQRYL